mgnify:CR=1 FL=1
MSLLLAPQAGHVLCDIQSLISVAHHIPHTLLAMCPLQVTKRIPGGYSTFDDSHPGSWLCFLPHTFD